MTGHGVCYSACTVFSIPKCNSIFETLGPYKPAKTRPRHQVRDAADPPPRVAHSFVCLALSSCPQRPRWNSRLDLVQNRRWLVTVRNALFWIALQCLSKSHRHLAGAASVASLRHPAPSCLLMLDSSRHAARPSQPRWCSLKPEVSSSSRLPKHDKTQAGEEGTSMQLHPAPLIRVWMQDGFLGQANQAPPASPPRASAPYGVPGSSTSTKILDAGGCGDQGCNPSHLPRRATYQPSVPTTPLSPT